MVALVAVLAVVLIAWALGSGGDPSADHGTGRSHRTSAGGPASTPASQSSSQSPSPTPAPSSSAPSPPANVTASGMEGFIRDYLATVTSDTKDAWRRLTPGFQAASGGYGQYRSFWSTISRADLVAANPDPADHRITYVVDYQRTNGSRSRDTTTLTLQGSDGHYRIAAEG
jgi:hypothetical protein